MKVMVTGAGALLGQGIIRALRGSALRATIVAVDPSPLAAGLYWADAAYSVPLVSDPAYLPHLRGLLERERPDALLVGTDVELPLLAPRRAELREEFGTEVLVSDPGVVGIADDKWLTYRFFREHGLPCPDSCLPGETESLLERVGFPLVVKPRVGARSVGVHVVHDRAALARALAEVPGAVVQECVSSPSEEYTAGAVVFDGRCRASIVMRRDLRDGNTYRAFVEEFPELNAWVREAAQLLGPVGPVNFQFRMDGDVPKVFEINARFSGTTPLRARAGFNEVEMCLRHLLLGEAVEQPPVDRLVILRHWSETVVSGDDFAALAAAGGWGG